MRHSSPFIFTLLASALNLALARPWFADRLPNGRLAANGQALGHFNPHGGGARNFFGEDFSRNHQWTPELCCADSDGDGQFNGFELGDVCCLWHPGRQEVLRFDNLSHPGDASSLAAFRLPAWLTCPEETPQCALDLVNNIKRSLAGNNTGNGSSDGDGSGRGEAPNSITNGVHSMATNGDAKLFFTLLWAIAIGAIFAVTLFFPAMF